jgi:uncharacterized protein (TIGR02001 family)
MTLKLLGASLISAAALAASATVASAEASKFSLSWNAGGLSDYVFRGVSQSAEDPVVFAGIDASYGIFYAGVWAAGLDFGSNGDGTNIADIEIDFYAGLKPTLGPVTFDIGVIYYAYPGANDDGPAVNQAREQDYVEIKAGASGAIVPGLPKLTLGGVVYYSPDYTGEQGETITTEASAAYELPKVGIFTPTVSGLVGAVYGEFDAVAFAAGGNGGFLQANGEDSYLYWNAGVTLAVDKLSFDFRYWDTDISNTGPVSGTQCTGSFFQCDERFVFSAKVTY